MIAKQRGELFRPKHQSLLMTKLVKACVLQILDVDVDHLVQALITLLTKPWQVLLQPEQPQPLLQAAWNMLWQTVPDVQPRDLHSQPFSVARILDPDGSQVLRRHPGDRGQVIAGTHEKPVILVESDLPKPGRDEVIVN